MPDLSEATIRRHALGVVDDIHLRPTAAYRVVTGCDRRDLVGIAEVVATLVPAREPAPHLRRQLLALSRPDLERFVLNVARIVPARRRARQYPVDRRRAVPAPAALLPRAS